MGAVILWQSAQLQMKELISPGPSVGLCNSNEVRTCHLISG